MMQLGDLTYTQAEALKIDPAARACDVCDGSGIEQDVASYFFGWGECHLCEGAGWFGADGYPLCDADDE